MAEIPIDKMVMAINRISDVMESLEKSPLKEDLIVALLHDKTKIPKKYIKQVLEHMAKMKEDWLKEEETL